MDAATIGALIGGLVIALGVTAIWLFVSGIDDVLALAKGQKGTKR